MNRSLFTVSAHGVCFDDNAEYWAYAADRLAAEHALIIPDVFEPSLLAKLSARAQNAPFSPYRLGPIGEQEAEADDRIASSINFLFNKPELLQRLSQLAGIELIEGIKGRVGRISAETGHQLQWHDDLNERSRRLALTVCLADNSYTGGQFELRSKETGEVHFTHHHQTPGTAVIFQIARNLEHRVTPVLSGGPRLVYAGWGYVGD